MTTPKQLDAQSRAFDGDWQGENYDSLKAKGLIVRDPEWPQFMRCTKTGMQYTTDSIQFGIMRAEQARAHAAQVQAQAQKVKL